MQRRHQKPQAYIGLYAFCVYNPAAYHESRTHTHTPYTCMHAYTVAVPVQVLQQLQDQTAILNSLSVVAAGLFPEVTAVDC
jgi:hypothetical protein